LHQRRSLFDEKRHLVRNHEPAIPLIAQFGEDLMLAPVECQRNASVSRYWPGLAVHEQ